MGISIINIRSDAFGPRASNAAADEHGDPIPSTLDKSQKMSISMGITLGPYSMSYG